MKKIIFVFDIVASLMFCMLIGSPEGQEFYEVVDDELVNISEVLWKEDQNISGVVFDLQGKLKPSDPLDTDRAPKKLFTSIPVGALTETQTLKNFTSLFKNYHADASISESFTSTQKQEISQFINSVIDTTVMEIAWEFLVNKNFSSSNRTEFAEQLKTIWFDLYSKNGVRDCCSGFEHVFIGEVNTIKSKTSGFHNWIRLYKEEHSSNVNYQGHYSDYDLEKGHIVSLKFSWNGMQSGMHPTYVKKIGSMFMQTTPEFEMAVYTICFYTRPGMPCTMSFNGHSFNITAVNITIGSTTHLLTAYPEA